MEMEIMGEIWGEGWDYGVNWDYGGKLGSWGILALNGEY